MACVARPRSVPSSPRLVVRPVERHGGGVVVEFVEADLELPHHLPRHGQDELRPTAVEHPVQATAQPIVLQQGQLVVVQIQHVGREGDGPLADAIDGFAGDQQIADQNQQCPSRGEFGAGIIGWQVLTQQLFELHPPQESIDDGERADLVASQSYSPRFRQASRLDRRFLDRAWARWGTCCTNTLARPNSHGANLLEGTIYLSGRTTTGVRDRSTIRATRCPGKRKRMRFET